MSAELNGDYFLRIGVEWARIATAIRAHYPNATDSFALGLWRKAAWCHLLFTAGKQSALLKQLRVLWATASQTYLFDAHRLNLNEIPLSATIFDLLRSVVVERYPAAFATPHDPAPACYRQTA